MNRPGPKPNPAFRRNYRATISLPNDVAEHFAFEADKSRAAENALRLYYHLTETQRAAMLAAALFNQRQTAV